MSELVEFIRGCLDADEQTAREATEGNLYHRYARMTPGAIADHIARHDPARVLAEVNAKRAILDLHAPLEWENAYCSRCDEKDDWPCRTVRALAQPFRGEPGWRDEWGTQ